MSARPRGPGRPSAKMSTARTEVFTLRLSEEDRDAIDAAATRAGKPVTQWAREALLLAAGATLSSQ